MQRTFLPRNRQVEWSDLSLALAGRRLAPRAYLRYETACLDASARDGAAIVAQARPPPAPRPPPARPAPAWLSSPPPRFPGGPKLFPCAQAWARGFITRRGTARRARAGARLAAAARAAAPRVAHAAARAAAAALQAAARARARRAAPANPLHALRLGRACRRRAPRAALAAARAAALALQAAARAAAAARRWAGMLEYAGRPLSLLLPLPVSLLYTHSLP